MDSTPNSNPSRCLVLIGFMGSGKSTIGRKLHDQLGYQLIDTDQLIEERQHKSIPQIFADEGEAFFRDLESALLRELAASPATNRIISTGGGIVLRDENRRLLQELGYVVWLRTPGSEILKRTSRNSNRPLLQTENPQAAIEAMLAEREPIYRETAHLEIDTGNLNIDEACAGILDCASYHFTQGE